MNQLLTWEKIPLLVLACSLAITVAVAQSNSGTQKPPLTDTVPPKQQKTCDLDEALAAIALSEAELQRAIKEMDREKLEAEIREAVSSLDMNMAKMEEELPKVKREIERKKIRQEIAVSMQKAELEKTKAEMQKAKDIDFKNIQEELAQIQPELDKAMKKAQVETEKARKEISDYKKLVNALVKDGLQKKGEHYRIEHKNNELTINGKKLSAEATKRYREYIRGKKDFTLQKNKDGLELDH